MIGTHLNQYRLDEIVGEGGMGVVYRALDMNLERTVAVKVLGATLREDADFVARFRQEARIQAGLNHPNIATLFDFFIWDDMPVAVMEFIRGETLRARVDRSGPIPAHIALPIFIQTLRGVAVGHKAGIIHRDLKPSNLMITDEGTVKITDFGIAKVRNNTGLTRVSTRVGSTSYMAPEQILGRPVDERTDIYILGGTLFELLTGRPPFQGLSQFEIDSAHVREPPRVPGEFYSQIPESVIAAVIRALAKEPADRFATAEEFIAALPDLHGVPYVAPVDDDATRVPQVGPSEPTSYRGEAPSPEPTVYRGEPPPPDPTIYRAEAPPPDPTVAPPAGLKRATTVVVGIGLLVLLVIGIGFFAMQGSVIGANNRAKRLPATTANEAVAPQPSAKQEAVLPAAPVHLKNLTGVWTGTYVDRARKPLLQLQNLRLEQSEGGDVTGRFDYRTSESGGEECTLEKSSYSTQSRRLRLIAHCHNPDHPKYLNVPLEFDNVDPAATTIAGGRLAFHLADDIDVTLQRANGT